METRFIYYNTNVVTQDANMHLPGMAKFKKFFSIYPQSSMFLDRTGTIKIPVRTHSLFPIPKLIPMRKTFEDICNERAVELLRRADSHDAKLHVLWSGGIDSTLVLISLLKNADQEQNKRIVVLLTEESITENPNFYYDHVRGKLVCESASMFPYILGTNDMITGGEHNDQLFGSDISAKLINCYGPSIIHEAYRRDTFYDFFETMINEPQASDFCVDIVERIAAKAPVTLSTNYDYLWWLSFAVKWQFVYVRMLPYVAHRNSRMITPAYVGDRYDQFFCTDNFQLWSMNNLDKKIKDGWRTYKWVCKEIIYDYTRDNEYRKNKQKKGSLAKVIQQQLSNNFVDTTYKMYPDLEVDEYYEPNNDFV